MILNEITNYLQSIAPLHLQESYDNAGLLVGDRSMEVRHALVAVDCTEEVVEEAKKKGCELIISHHPIIFGKIERLIGSDYVERVVIDAVKNDIAIYAAHTNLDNVHIGVNRMICNKLALVNCRMLKPKKGLLRKLYTFCPEDQADQLRNALFTAGCGHIGDYSECSFNVEGYGTFSGGESTDPYVGEKNVQNKEPEIRIEVIYPVSKESKVLEVLFDAHPYDEVAYDIIALENEDHRVGSGMIGELADALSGQEFLEHLKKTMQLECIRHTKLLEREVKTVAVCGGAGGFLLNYAIAGNADFFITADLKYHQFFDAENKIVIADIGHYESERFTKELIVELLKEKFPTFAVHLSEVNTNPITYF